jgi:hypothetical protein
MPALDFQSSAFAPESGEGRRLFDTLEFLSSVARLKSLEIHPFNVAFVPPFVPVFSSGLTRPPWNAWERVAKSGKTKWGSWSTPNQVSPWEFRSRNGR